MKVALVYDRVNKWGGAERVLLALHKIFPDAPLFTSVYDRKKAPWASSFTVKTSFLQKIPFFRSRHELIPFLMPIAFEQFGFDEFDLVISVSSEAAKGILTKPGTKHVCICLTPTRYLWSGYMEYFPNALVRALVTPLIWYLRLWDIVASQRIDTMIAISQEVQQRIQKYYGRESTIIYPPLSLPVIPAKAGIQKKKEWIPDHVRDDKYKEKYFLVVSRLSRFTKYKRIDLAIAAATKLGINLIVVGDGDKSMFGDIAGSTITFVENVSDTQLENYYRNAQALLFPGCEDFGLTMVEALSFGTPVIAYKAGGALEIVREGITGTFFQKQTIASISEVLKSFDRSRYNSATCKKSVEKFSEKLFAEAIKKTI